MFYLLLYGILENEKLSQRTLEDTFNDVIFKTLFDLDKSESIRRSSISERLSKIDSDYFRQIYQCVYHQFYECLFQQGWRKNITWSMLIVLWSVRHRVNCWTGLDNKVEKSRSSIGIAFDGLLPCHSMCQYRKVSSEDIALPQAILNHVKQKRTIKNIYVIDRGLQSTKNNEIIH